MAPDKIFIHKKDLSYSEIKESDSDIIYIRKDALLEWVKSQKARLKQGYKREWKNDDTLNGGRLMLDKLINKIESL